MTSMLAHPSSVELARLANSTVTLAEVTTVRRISPAFVELVFTHASAHDIAGIPGSHVLVRLEEEDGTEVHRRYAIREVDAETDELALWICTDHDGVGARWATEAQPGDVVEMIGPFDTIHLDAAADLHLLIGDMTSIATFYRFGDLVEKPAEVTFIIQVNSIDAAAAEAVRKGFDAKAYFVSRSGRAHSDPEGLLRGLAAYEWPTGRVHAYILAESGASQALSEALLARGLEPDQISVLPTWHEALANADDGWPEGEAAAWAESVLGR